MDEDPWAEYARLQSMLDRTTDVHKAAGIEAAMVDLLDKIQRGETVNANQVNNLVVNRIGKERRRRAIVNAKYQDMPGDIVIASAAESRLMLLKCAQACGERDFILLVRQAEGHTFGELSAVTAVCANTLKTWAHRARKKLLALAA